MTIFQVQFSSATSTIDCSFESEGSFTKCGYRIGWDGMTRANWKFVTETKDKKICEFHFERVCEKTRLSQRVYLPTET